MSHSAWSRPADERDLLDRAAEWSEYRRWQDLTDDALRQITRDQGIDFATALLFDRIVGSQEHGPFIRRINHLRQRQVEEKFGPNVLVAIVPGAFYVERPFTGADGEAVSEAARGAGCRTEVISVASLGTPVFNGRVICDWLSQKREERIILVSLSKGGADVKMALAEPHSAKAFENVVAWLNVSGIVNGSPMVTWGRTRPLLRLLVQWLFWFRGRDFRFVDDLRQEGGPLDFPFRTPQHITTIHIVASLTK